MGKIWQKKEFSPTIFLSEKICSENIQSKSILVKKEICYEKNYYAWLAGQLEKGGSEGRCYT